MDKGKKKFWLTAEVIKESSKKIWQDRSCSLGLNILIVLIVFSVANVAIMMRKLPPQIPLWLSRPWGESQLAAPYWLWLLPGWGAIWTLMGVVVAGRIVSEDKLLARMLVWGMVLGGFLTTYALVRIELLMW